MNYVGKGPALAFETFFFLEMLKLLTNAHVVGGRPTLKGIE